ANVDAQLPGCAFVPGAPGEQSLSFAASSCSVMLTARRPVASPRVSTNGTETQVWSAFRQSPAPFAATVFTAGAAVTESVYATVPAQPRLSVAVIENTPIPAATGVREIWPV